MGRERQAARDVRPHTGELFRTGSKGSTGGLIGKVLPGVDGRHALPADAGKKIVEKH